MDRKYLEMIMKRLIIAISILLIACACEEIVVENDLKTTHVTLSLSGTPQLKADSPLIPDVENLIYDVWILQYNDKGLLIDAGTSHERKTNPGALVAPVTATLAVLDNCTICVLANIDRGRPDAMRTWPQTLTEFKTSAEILAEDIRDDIMAANSSTLTDMPMFGYWEGNITANDENIQVSLGRMLTRINLVINNESGSECTATSISNLAVKGYAFPDINHDPLPASAYIETFEINESIGAGKSRELYFYSAPNFTDGESRATKLNFSNGKSVILSNGAPSTENRDYNLYHNSNYTFTINIKP